MTEFEYRADPEGINQLANGPEMHALLFARARRGADWVRGNAPVRTGHYRAGIQVVDKGRGGPRRDRAEVQIQATSDDAIWVEVGARGRPGHHLLSRCIPIVENG
ncbi:hypothetical protein ACWEVP_31715 [Amycolatopsis sp. NPDC003865]